MDRRSDENRSVGGTMGSNSGSSGNRSADERKESELLGAGDELREVIGGQAGAGDAQSSATVKRLPVGTNMGNFELVGGRVGNSRFGFANSAAESGVARRFCPGRGRFGIEEEEKVQARSSGSQDSASMVSDEMIEARPAEWCALDAHEHEHEHEHEPEPDAEMDGDGETGFYSDQGDSDSAPEDGAFGASPASAIRYSPHTSPPSQLQSNFTSLRDTVMEGVADGVANGSGSRVSGSDRGGALAPSVVSETGEYAGGGHGGRGIDYGSVELGGDAPHEGLERGDENVAQTTAGRTLFVVHANVDEHGDVAQGRWSAASYSRSAPGEPFCVLDGSYSLLGDLTAKAADLNPHLLHIKGKVVQHEEGARIQLGDTRVGAGSLARLADDMSEPRCVVLSGGANDLVARELCERAKVPVVCFRDEVTDDAAAAFTHAFYTQLAEVLWTDARHPSAILGHVFNLAVTQSLGEGTFVQAERGHARAAHLPVLLLLADGEEHNPQPATRLRARGY